MKKCKYDCTNSYSENECENCNDYFSSIEIECSEGSCDNCNKDHLQIGFCHITCAIEYLGLEKAKEIFKYEFICEECESEIEYVKWNRIPTEVQYTIKCKCLSNE